MSLGVLNNLSAVYAENNLNNTNNSLSTVLQQLSSGSKINSGADDAAGLSLVNGLQANQQALKQSQTNATEGVGLLQVADGALSQVTSLLNRAVTLATEASNGTLNSTQDLAANQEYQSILSEISNIGTTTTYNQEQVFNSQTNIYTGDSSTQGSSVDALNIRTLSSANLGDTSGTMSYSGGTNNVFINLSNGGINASTTDSLGASTATTTIQVGYMTQGAGGSAVSATANISVGAGTTYGNTVNGLISAINNAGLGLTAAFTTAGQAGSAAVAAATAANSTGGGANSTGIQISAVGVGTGTNGTGEIGTLTTAGNADLLGGTLTVVASDGASHAITLGTANSTDNLSNLAATINGGNYGVTATYNSTNHNVVFTSANSGATVTGTSITDQTSAAASDTANLAIVNSGLAKNTAGTAGTITVGNATDTLTGGTITLLGSNGADVGGGAITLGTKGTTDTLANLAAYINSQTAATPGLGFSASVNAAGTVLTIASTIAAGALNAPTVTAGTLANAPTAMTPAVSVSTALTGTPTIGNTAYSGAVGTLTLGGASTDTLSGTLNIGANTIVLGTATGANKTDTMAHLMATINNGNYGVTASLNTAATAAGNAIGTVMSFNSPDTAINVSGTGLGDATATTALTAIAANTTVNGTQTIVVGATGNILSGTIAGTDKSGNAYSITLGQAGTTDTLANLSAYINADTALGITSVLSGAGNTTATFSKTAGGAPTIGTTNLANSTAALSETVNAPYANQLGTLAISGTGAAAGDTLGGTLNIGSVAITLGSVAVAGYHTDTLANLAATINKENMGVTATLNTTATPSNAVGTVMTLTSTQPATAGVKVSGTTLVDMTQGDTGVLTATNNTPATDASAYYKVGITSGTGGITDYSTAVNSGTAVAPVWSYGGSANVGFAADNNGTGGVATVSYSDAAGQSLSQTDLTNAADAQAALGDLNKAISDVAAQDGYIGAMINTLTAVSQVLSTQSENVQSAQNAVQATDYASATSNMSKYEILSQTGISALAQANSMQQEVTKLLQ
jgi:flagellin